MRFKIRTKLIIAFLSIIFSFIVIGGILAFYSANAIHNSVHKIKSIAEERAVIANLIFDMEKALMPGNDYIITGDKKYIDEFYKASDDVEKIMKEAELIVSNAETRKVVGGSRIAFQNIKEITQKIFEIPNPVGDKEAARLMEEMDYKWAYPSVERLKERWNMYMEEYRKAVNTADRVRVHSWIIMIVGTFILIAIGSFFALFYSRIFVLPIKQVHNGADAIAKGDFKVRLDIKTGDEIEQLSKAMNEMAKQLDTLYLNMGAKIEEGIKKFAAITESANDAIIVLSSPDVIHFWNKKAEEMFGYRIDDVLGKSIHGLIAPLRDREKAKEGLKNFFKTGQGPIIGKVVEVFGIHKDGREFPIELSVSAVRIGEEWQAIGIIRDITERKRLENELKEREERFKQLFHGGKDAIFVNPVMPDGEPGNFIEVNDMACERLGFTREELLNMSPMDIDAPDMSDKRDAIIKEFAENKHASFEMVHIAKDGRRIPVEINAKLFELNGKPMVLSIVRDITERKRAEEIVREKEQSYIALFENMMDGFAYCKMLFDEHDRPVDFVYLDVNNSFERLTGLKNVVGKRVTEVIPGIKESHPELFDIYGRVALTGKSERFEIYFKPLAIWLFISIYSIKKGYFIAVFDNITERKKSEVELMQKLDELEQFRKITINRELRMEELKRKNKELEEELKILRGMR